MVMCNFVMLRVKHGLSTFFTIPLEKRLRLNLHPKLLETRSYHHKKQLQCTSETRSPKYQ